MTRTDSLDPCAYRLDIATQLAHACPSSLASEIAATGSVARNCADHRSDLELNLWTAGLPSGSERIDWIHQTKQTAWLTKAGATDINPDDALNGDGSIWCTFNFSGIWVELGWQSLVEHDRLLRDILAANVTDHDRLILADVTSRALPLRTSGALSEWKALLTDYPERLRKELILTAASHWQYVHYLDTWWDSRPEQQVCFAQDVLDDLTRVLRIVYALNRVWEPHFKWIRADSDSMALRPVALAERLESMTSVIDSRAREGCCHLILETLRLVQQSYDVSVVTSRVEDALTAYTNRRAPP